ncbi:unnamed protein product [Fraxinus pennsylvanica]|uniref:Uncharacterized protein n=1 Tax=Fraxinus pennsylvanica TaxID=56036 RepID=A0AAD1Z6L6_9LAMI|nr:unnamed protein product [Fraxinus pennsylvanica]
MKEGQKRPKTPRLSCVMLNKGKHIAEAISTLDAMSSRKYKKAKAEFEPLLLSSQLRKISIEAYIVHLLSRLVLDINRVPLVEKSFGFNFKHLYSYSAGHWVFLLIVMP